jgi:hypothetical protein
MSVLAGMIALLLKMTMGARGVLSPLPLSRKRERGVNKMGMEFNMKSGISPSPVYGGGCPKGGRGYVYKFNFGR